MPEQLIRDLIKMSACLAKKKTHYKETLSPELIIGFTGGNVFFLTASSAVLKPE